MKLVIVDYGMGNLRSVTSAIRYLGYEQVEISNDPLVLSCADKLILPGVGNYARAMSRINELNLTDIIRSLVLADRKPILGICLGMQLMGKSSTEGGFNEGLCLVDGLVEAFEVKDLKVPHVGYNQVTPCQNSRLYSEVGGEPDYYFTHSFRMTSQTDIGNTTCFYGERFIAGFEVENIAGVQFHPELSQTNGLKLLKNFIELF
ncbi:MAG: imidazole glycerol phosphate synthase subunit HisH [Cellvibrio sp.]|nr:imidazole glycerol phosphate synthase subunit HisH [Cellvibrio sp.]